MSIRWKLISAFSLPIVILVVTAFVVNGALKTLQDAVNVVILGIEVQQAGATAEEMITELRAQANAAPDATDHAKTAELMAVFWGQLQASFDVIDKDTAAMGIEAETTEQIAKSRQNVFKEYNALSQTLTAAEPDIEVLFEKSIFLDEELGTLSEAISVFNIAVNERIALAVEEEKRVHDRPTQAMLVATVIGGAVLMVFAVLFARTLVRPLRDIGERLREIAEGDLTLRANDKRRDEIGELAKWFNFLVDCLHDLIVEVQSVVGKVDVAADQISRSSEEINRSMSDQTQQIESVTSAVDKVSESTSQVALRSGEAADHAAKAGKLANTGGEMVQLTIGNMQAIRDAVGSTSKVVEALRQRGMEIGQVTSVINDIADQTNLLALNAAIESARAGEHGRGFAVVADQVRKLADRTTQATQEIAGSIQAIQEETAEAVDKMREGEDKVDKGLSQANEMGHSLKEIVGSANKVADMIEVIASATTDQTSAAQHVAGSLEEIAHASNQTTQGSKLTLESTFELASRLENLTDLMGKFTVNASAEPRESAAQPQSTG